MSGVYHIQALPGTSQDPVVTIVALPPSRQTGIVPFGPCRVFLTSDFAGARIRLAVGSSGPPAGVSLAALIARENPDLDLVTTGEDPFKVSYRAVDRGHHPHHPHHPPPHPPPHPQALVDDAGASNTIIPVEPSDDVLSIVHSGLDEHGQPGGKPVGVSVFFESASRNFAYHAQAKPNSTTIVSLVPTKFHPKTRTFVSLATDFEPARVRFAIGREENFRVSNEGQDVIVPVGREFIVEAQENDEIVSIVHREGMPVGVLVVCGAFD